MLGAIPNAFESTRFGCLFEVGKIAFDQYNRTELRNNTVINIDQIEIFIFTTTIIALTIDFVVYTECVGIGYIFCITLYKVKSTSGLLFTYLKLFTKPRNR